MIEKRGQSGWRTFGIIAMILFIIIFIVIIFGLVTSSDPGAIFKKIGLPNFSEALDEDAYVPTSFSSVAVFNNKDLEFLDYLFGYVPEYLITKVGNGVSAGIIMIGIWVLFFLTFGDVVRLFGSFNTIISWIIAFVLTLIAANLKFTGYLAVVGLSITAGFGVLSVILALIFIFVLFILFNLGIQPINQWILYKKEAEMTMRAAMGSTRAAKGLETLKKIERSAEKGESK